MVDIVDLKYALMLSGRLDQFKVVSHNPYKLRFRCPYCGDSNKSATKSRGWLQESKKNSSLRFYCFNCHQPASFYDFLKTHDPLMFNDWVTEKFVDKTRQSSSSKEIPTDIGKRPVFRLDIDPLKKIKKISQLKVDHPAKIYIESRQIPHDKHYLLHYAPKFMTWINTIIPNKFEIKGRDEPRLVLPLLDENGKIFGVSARGFNPNGLRYITIMFDENKSKIFGLNTVNFSKPYYIVEGAIDSLFLKNAIAMAGADGNMIALSQTQNAVFVFDCEYRNKQILDRIDKLISKGINVCLWPKHMVEKGKDINDFILSGLTSENITTIIRENTYNGLMAKMVLNDRKNI